MYFVKSTSTKSLFGVDLFCRKEVEADLNDESEAPPHRLSDLVSQNENGEVLGPFLAVASTPTLASGHAGRERLGDLSLVPSNSSSMSPLPQSPAQAMAYRGREGSFDSRYQSPLDDLRVSQEALLEHMDSQNRR